MTPWLLFFLQQKRSSPPYKAMLKSVPVWGFMGLMVCHYIASSLLFTFIPLYLTDILGLPVEEVTFSETTTTTTTTTTTNRTQTNCTEAGWGVMEAGWKHK